MRRFFSFLLVACLLLSLCACHVDDNTTTAPSNTNTNTTAPSGTTAPPVDVDITVKTDGWINIEPSGSMASCIAFGGYYHCVEMDRQFLAFTDINNGTTVVLCSKAGCKHHQETSQAKKEKCDAYLGSAVFLMYTYGDKIYYNSDDDGYSGVDLYSRNADGTGKQKVADLGADYVTSKSSITIPYYLPVGDQLYYKIEVNGTVLREDGVYEVQTVKQVLMRLDLTTGKETLIGEFVGEFPHIVAAREDQLLFLSYGKSNSDAENGEDRNTRPVYLKVWDENVKQTDVLFEKTNNECFGTGFVVGSKYYYNGIMLDEDGQEYSGDLAYDLATEVTEKTDLGSEPLNGRYLFSGTSVYDAQEKTVLPADFSAIFCKALDRGDDGFILLKAFSEEGGTGDWDYSVYAYVTYDALADGLQASDCLDFYTKH